MLNRLIGQLSMVGLGLGLGGCGTQITSLTPAGKEIAALQLNEAFPYTQKSFTHLWLSRLSAGEYRPLGQDARGTFYEGPSRCYSQRVLKPGPFAPDSSRNFVTVADCAVYLPKDAAMPGKVLVVTGSERNIQLDNPDASEVEVQKQVDVAMRDISVPLAISQNAAGNSVQAGIGAGLAWGLIGAMAAAEQGRLNDAFIQPAAGALRDALQPKQMDLAAGGAD